jgi:hypothetical protein
MLIPETRYTSSGGISIAYQVHGEGSHDLLFAGTTASNIETIWHLPEAARFFERLGTFARVIRFDRRDTGISDPTKEDLTLEAHAEDALAAAGSRRAAPSRCWPRPTPIGSRGWSRSLRRHAAAPSPRPRSPTRSRPPSPT